MSENDDFGARLTEALREGSRHVPVLADPAGAARTRRAERRRNRVLIGVSAAVVAALALAVPHGFGSSKGAPEPAGPVHRTDFTGRGWIPAGWRSETWNGIEMAVPRAWRYGDLSQSCTLPNDDPVFDRPGGPSTLVGCMGPQGYGVRFEDPREVDPDHTYPAPGVGLLADKPIREFPEHAAVRTAVVDGTMVLVVLKDPALADRMIATVHRVGEVDANGCAPTADVPVLGTPITTVDDGAPLSVCRYATGGAHLGNRPGDVLEQSELLSAEDSAATRAALADAPAGTGPDASPRTCEDLPNEPGEAVELRTPAGPVAWVHFSNCTGHGVDTAGTTRRLTQRVLHWAISPGWADYFTGPEYLIDDLRGYRVN